jgi:hypothetical protein
MKELLFCLMLINTAVLAQPCIQNNSSVAFNGTSSYVAISTSNGLTITGPISVEAWINPSQWATIAAQGTILCKHSWDQGEQGYVLRAGDNGILSFNFAGLTPGGIPVSWIEVLSPQNSLVLNSWQHVAATFDGDSVKLYVNGVQVGLTLFQGTIVASNASNIRIGALSDNTYGPDRFWNGLIDEVRVWNRELSALEINTNKDDHLDPVIQSGLKGYWRFNENSSVIAFDLSSNNNTGQLTGNTWSTSVPFNNAAVTPTISFNGTQLISSLAQSYQWLFNGIVIPGSVSQGYTPALNGNYAVITTDLNGCIDTSLVYPFNSVGINELNSSGYLIYSQENGKITIGIPLGSHSIEIMEVFDLSGKKIAQAENISGSYEFNLIKSAGTIVLLRIATAEKVQTFKICLK